MKRTNRQIIVKDSQAQEIIFNLTETEVLIYDMVLDLSITVKDKLKLICHYSTVLDYRLFNYLFDIALFMQQLKRKARKSRGL